MKYIFRISIVFLVCLFTLQTHAQEKQNNKSPLSNRAHRKAAKKKWKESRATKREHDKLVKEHHKRLQSKNTRKDMRREKRKGDKMRRNKRGFFK